MGEKKNEFDHFAFRMLFWRLLCDVKVKRDVAVDNFLLQSILKLKLPVCCKRDRKQRIGFNIGKLKENIEKEKLVVTLKFQFAVLEKNVSHWR